MKKGHCTFSPDKPFNKCCAQHDVDYMRKQFTRYEADKLFLNCMLNIAGKRPHIIAMAYIYYYAVRMFGGFFWRKN